MFIYHVCPEIIALIFHLICRPKRNIVLSTLTVDELCDHITTFEHGKVSGSYIQPYTLVHCLPYFLHPHPPPLTTPPFLPPTNILYPPVASISLSPLTCYVPPSLPPSLVQPAITSLKARLNSHSTDASVVYNAVNEILKYVHTHTVMLRCHQTSYAQVTYVDNYIFSLTASMTIP